MKVIIRVSIAIIIYTFFLAGIQANAEEAYLFRVSDKRIIGYEQMINEIKDVDLVFVGELHDSELHHRMQLDLIKALHDSRTPIAVGLEMFTAESQGVLDQWVAGTIPMDSFVKSYYGNWKVPWTYYNDIFLFIRENRIPALGLNLPRQTFQKVARAGFYSLPLKEIEGLPPAIACDVDKDYMDFIIKVYEAHRHRRRLFVHFCEAQMLKDRSMAWRLAEFLEGNPDKKIVVLTGARHAWKKAIPKEIKNLSKEIRYIVILPLIPGSIEPGYLTTEDADYILLDKGQ